jgi:hypothetical protein
MFSLALSFLTGKKQIIIKYLLFLSVFALSLFIVYNKGISNGKQQEKNRLYEEYSKILEERLKENTDRLTREFSEKLDIEKNKVKIEANTEIYLSSIGMKADWSWDKFLGFKDLMIKGYKYFA